MSRDLHATLARLSEGSVRLDIPPVHLGFLVASRHRGRSEASLDESLLRDLFEDVYEIYHPAAPLPQKAATHAFESLRNQRLLARVDGAGLVRRGAYVLTPLAVAIVDFFVEDDSLTRESLAVLLRTLRSTFVQAARAAAEAGRDAALWSDQVEAPLLATGSEIVRAIDRRQRGMDAQQEEVREEVAVLLEQGWFEAIEHCEKMLDETARTLRELNDVLVVEVGALHGQLAEVERLAMDADRLPAQRAVREVADQLTRVEAWGRDRHEAWSEYFQFIQRYIRGVVRLDRDRALSGRLRDALKGYSERPWGLLTAAGTGYRALREPERHLYAVPVRRLRDAASLEPPREVVPEAPAFDADAWVLDALAGLPPGRRLALVELLRRHLPDVAEADRYRAAGLAAAALVRHGLVEVDHAPRWGTPIADLEVHHRHATARPGDAS